MANRRAIHALLLVLALGGAVACSSGAPARSAADLTNPFLGPERSSWLIGPIARIATREEIDGFLALRDDAQAEAFIDRFWASRDATPNEPGNPLRQAFDERAAEADRLYSEAGYRGRRTDRGTIHVLYGPPSETDFEVSPRSGDPPIELWTYTSAAPAGLDGKRPAPAYRFIKRGDLTAFYVPRQDPRLRNRPEPDPF